VYQAKKAVNRQQEEIIMSEKTDIFKKVHEIIGDSLPESHVFYATQGLPNLTYINKLFGNWYSFSNAYLKFIKAGGVEIEPTVPVVEKGINSTEIAEVDLDE
jgi:hypothetical protein